VHVWSSHMSMVVRRRHDYRSQFEKRRVGVGVVIKE
jgi:hypothetical protein